MTSLRLYNADAVDSSEKLRSRSRSFARFRSRSSLLSRSRSSLQCRSRSSLINSSYVLYFFPKSAESSDWLTSERFASWLVESLPSNRRAAEAGEGAEPRPLSWQPSRSCRRTLRRNLARAFWNQTWRRFENRNTVKQKLVIKLSGWSVHAWAPLAEWD